MEAPLLPLPIQQQLNFAGKWPHLAPMPDVLQAYVIDHLHKQEITAIKLTSQGGKFFIERRHRVLTVFRDPHHFGKLRTYNDLTKVQKRRLEFFKFDDRPLWQRVGIVAGCVVLSPLIVGWHIVWHGPRVVLYAVCWTGKKVLLPACEWTGKTIGCLWKHLVWPSLKILGRATAWTWDHTVVPAFYATRWAIRHLRDDVIVPVCHGICDLAQWIWKEVLAPAGRGVGRGLSCVYNALAECVNCVWNHVVKPAGQWVQWCILVPLWNAVLYPCLKGLGYLLKFLLWTVPTQLIKLVLYTLPKTILTYGWRWVCVPIGRVLGWIWVHAGKPFCTHAYVIIHGVCVVFAGKILHKVWQGISAVGGAINSYVIQPVVSAVCAVTRATVSHCIVPVAHAVAAAGCAIGRAIQAVVVPIARATSCVVQAIVSAFAGACRAVTGVLASLVSSS